MPFASILEPPGEAPPATPDATLAAVFHDLNFDQIVTGATEGRAPYDLAGFFGHLLSRASSVAYRHEVLRDLERPEVRSAIDAFATAMRSVRARIAQADKLRQPFQQASWRLDATIEYANATETLTAALGQAPIASAGLRSLREYLTGYLESAAYRSFAVTNRTLATELDRVHYGVFVLKSRVTVQPFQDEADYSAEVAATFERFQQTTAADHRVARRDPYPEVNHVEEQILLRVAPLFPQVFARLTEFERQHREFLDATVVRFDREVQFYLGYLDAIAPLRKAGLEFCYPEVVEDSKEETATATFDLALARQLHRGGAAIVPNDFALHGAERILVVSGPNQGGKTTFARTFGQLHLLAALGLLVPGRDVRLALVDRVLAHFEREEHMEDLRGKLLDELVRVREIFERLTARTVVVFNESFSTTTVEDAEFLGSRVLEELVRRDVLAVYVTFLDELSRLGPATVSMVSTVVPDDPARRTFHILRQRADGRAYALVVANQYGLSEDRIRERVHP